MSEYAGELIMREKKGILIVVSGFSGAGKGTLMKKLMQTMIILHYRSLQPRDSLVSGKKMEESIFLEPKKNLKK